MRLDIRGGRSGCQPRKGINAEFGPPTGDEPPASGLDIVTSIGSFERTRVRTWLRIPVTVVCSCTARRIFRRLASAAGRCGLLEDSSKLGTTVAYLTKSAKLPVGTLEDSHTEQS